MSGPYDQLVFLQLDTPFLLGVVGLDSTGKIRPVASMSESGTWTMGSFDSFPDDVPGRYLCIAPGQHLEIYQRAIVGLTQDRQPYFACTQYRSDVWRTLEPMPVPPQQNKFVSIGFNESFMKDNWTTYYGIGGDRRPYIISSSYRRDYFAPGCPMLGAGTGGNKFIDLQFVNFK